MTLKFKKILSIVCLVAMLIAMVGCASTEETYVDYSYGLTKDGLYENLSNYPCELPDWSKLCFSYDDVLQWGANSAVSETDDVKTVDEYIYEYGKDILIALGLAGKDVAEIGDTVSVGLEFYIDGEQLEDYTSSGSYEVCDDGDAIMRSFVGHHVNDVYEVEYTFPEDDMYYPGKVATVKVTVSAVSVSDPIANGAVESNLDVIGEYLDGVIDVETFLTALRPELAKSTFESFVEDYMQNLDNVSVPDEYAEYELYRLKFRLQQVGYDYKQYLESTGMTDDEAREYCAMVALENYIAMSIYVANGYEISSEDVAEYYGDSLEYVLSMQGEPYARLKMIREVVLHSISEQITLNETGEILSNDAHDAIGAIEDATQPDEPVE